ncbi:MAG: hypothetical protein ACT4OY_00885 [Alphaproteobacteria bacterium]
MFTNLGSIFVHPPRHAESADTRAEIKRHDPDQQKRRDKDHRDEPEIAFDTDDTATISVPALLSFLDNFLSSQGSQTSAGAVNVQGNAPTAPASKAAQAAGAYARTGHITHPTAAAPPPESGMPQLSAEELRLMYSVRTDVQTLIARNVEILKIEKGENFLASLAASVSKALNS